MSMTCRDALLLVLDQVDYTKGACGLTEMVGAVLPKEVIVRAREAIAADTGNESVDIRDGSAPQADGDGLHSAFKSRHAAGEHQ